MVLGLLWLHIYGHTVDTCKLTQNVNTEHMPDDQWVADMRNVQLGKHRSGNKMPWEDINSLTRTWKVRKAMTMINPMK